MNLTSALFLRVHVLSCPNIDTYLIYSINLLLNAYVLEKAAVIQQSNDQEPTQ